MDKQALIKVQNEAFIDAAMTILMGCGGDEKAAQLIFDSLIRKASNRVVEAQNHYFGKGE